MKKNILLITLVLTTILLAGCSKKPNRKIFYKEVGKYVISGELFSSKWTNVERVTWSENLGNGRFLVNLKFKEGYTQYYAVSSFYFSVPSSQEFISELDKLSLDNFTSEKIANYQCRAFGWITFEDLGSNGRSISIFGRGGLFRKKEDDYQWNFAQNHISDVTFMSIDGIKAYKQLSKYVKLGTAEENCLKNRFIKLSHDEHVSMYNRVNDAVMKIEK